MSHARIPHATCTLHACIPRLCWQQASTVRLATSCGMFQLYLALKSCCFSSASGMRCPCFRTSDGASHTLPCASTHCGNAELLVHVLLCTCSSAQHRGCRVHLVRPTSFVPLFLPCCALTNNCKGSPAYCGATGTVFPWACFKQLPTTVGVLATLQFSLLLIFVLLVYLQNSLACSVAHLFAVVLCSTNPASCEILHLLDHSHYCTLPRRVPLP